MPYAVKFYAYIFIANVLAFVIVARWIHPFGFVASLVKTPSAKKTPTRFSPQCTAVTDALCISENKTKW